MLNDAQKAILNGAIQQLGALATSSQTRIDADTADVQAAQAKLDADNADISTQKADLDTTNSLVTALSNLLSSPAPTP